MRILHVTPSFYPATFWGGPIWSTKAICDGIAADPDFTLRVLTTDSAGPRLSQRVQRVPLPYPVRYAWRLVGHAGAPGLLARLPAAIAWADVVHLTAVYNAPTLPTLALCRLFAKPLVWSQRGAVQATAEWAQSPHRRLKGLFAQAAAAVMPRETAIHVTAGNEAAAQAIFAECATCHVIPNAVAVPHSVPARQPSSRFRLLFLGRLHQKKGLDLLIAAMPHLPERVTLDIYGTGESDYVYAVQQVAKATGCDIRFHGHVTGAAKAAAFAEADLFVLPSYSENFGIAVAEALAHGVPVLTTDATPWQGLATYGCGQIMSLETGDLADAIVTMMDADLPAMGARGRDWMIRDFGPEAMVARFAALYRDLGQGAVEGVAA